MKRVGTRLRRMLYAGFLAVAAVAAFAWREPLVAVWRTQATTLFEAVVLMALALVIQTRNFLSFLDSRHDVDLWPLCRVWAVTALFNYLGPFQPGVALRAAYLAGHGVRWRDSLLATWRQLCVSVWISLGGAGLGLAVIGDGRLRVLGLVLGAGFVALPMARTVLIRILHAIRRPALLVSRRELLIDALSGVDISGVLGVVVQYAVGTLLLWIVYRGFGADIGFAHALVLACMVYVSSLVAVLPGNLGILDAIYVFGGQGAGLTLAQSAALAVLLRCAQIISCILVALAGPPISLKGSVTDAAE